MTSRTKTECRTSSNAIHCYCQHLIELGRQCKIHGERFHLISDKLKKLLDFLFAVCVKNMV